MTTAPIRICFVCLGNICRSPTAEGVMRQLIQDAGLEAHFVIGSGGTGAYHEGQPADVRTRAEALRRGVTLSGRARQFKAADFDAFDYVIAMDRQNQRDLERIARSPAERAKVHRLRTFDPGSSHDLDVPDPYSGGPDGFATVYDICLAGCQGLLAHLRAQYRL